jgi:enterochelin esterase-like enzyme
MRMLVRFFQISVLFNFWLASCTTFIPVTPTPSTSPTATETNSPAPSPTPLACSQSIGNFEHQQIQTSLMTHPLQFRVYLPACYGNDKDKRYPVLYLLHGQSFTDDQWDRLGADEAMDELISSGEVPPFILVLPKESNYMITQWESKYGQALAAELVPWVDAHYQTCRDRACRAIGGLSRGAGWAMRIGLMASETFSAIGAHSAGTLTPSRCGSKPSRMGNCRASGLMSAPVTSSPMPPGSGRTGWIMTRSPMNGMYSPVHIPKSTGRTM